MSVYQIDGSGRATDNIRIGVSPRTMTRALILIFAFAVIGFTSQSGVVSAQAVRGSDQLNISISPEAPAPGTRTTISITSLSIDLSTADISWSTNGAQPSSGPGLRSYTFTMGPSGEGTVVSLSVTPRQGTGFTRSFTFRPGTVTLIWEADTYTPPFYRGKALYAPGADLKVMAVPSVYDNSGSLIPKNELTFKWSIDEEADASVSGRGRDVLYLSGKQLNEQEIVSVEVLRSDKLKVASSETIIPATQPLVRFYKRDPLRGVLYDRSIFGTTRLTDTETTLQVEPFFISGGSREPYRLIYTWTLNDQEVDPQGADRSAITLRQTNGQTGFAKLVVTFQNSDLKKLLQQASATLGVEFGGGGDSSVFGI